MTGGVLKAVSLAFAFQEYFYEVFVWILIVYNFNTNKSYLTSNPLKMETNETFEPISPEPGLTLTFEAQSYLREAGKWASFLGILGFIFCAIILIFALFAGSIFTRMAAVSPTALAVALAGMGGVVSFIYILFDVLYFFFALYLYQFGDKIKKGITFTDTAHVTSALGKLKSFFKLWGVVTIILLAFYALAIIAFIAIGVGAASMMHN